MPGARLPAAIAVISPRASFFWQAARLSCREFVLQFVSYLIVKQGVIWPQLEATRAHGAHSHNSELSVAGSVAGITSLITPLISKVITIFV